MPDARPRMANLFHGFAGTNRLIISFSRDRLHIFTALDKKPWFLAKLFPSTHPDKRPVSLQLLAIEPKVDFAFLQRLRWIASEDFVGAAIPKHDRTRAVIAFRNDSFETAIL